MVRLAGDVPMTVLVPNADEEERGRLPGGGADVRLSWAPEHIHLIKESAAAVQRQHRVTMRRMSIATALLAVVVGLTACGGVVGGPAAARSTRPRPARSRASS